MTSAVLAPTDLGAFVEGLLVLARYLQPDGAWSRDEIMNRMWSSISSGEGKFLERSNKKG